MRLTATLCQRFFQRFIERKQKEALNSAEWWKPVVGWKRVGRIQDWYYNEHRPWTEDAIQANRPRQKPKIELIRPIKHWTIFKGDRVQVLVGKDKGKVGIVHMIIHERNWVFVEGLHLEVKEIQGEGGAKSRQMREKPLMVPSEVSLVDPSDNKPTAVEWRYNENGESVRTSERSGRVIPLPIAYTFYEDGFIDRNKYKISSKDTRKEDLEEITFKPKLSTFEQDILQERGIKLEPKRSKTYWY